MRYVTDKKIEKLEAKKEEKKIRECFLERIQNICEIETNSIKKIRMKNCLGAPPSSSYASSETVQLFITSI